MTNAQNRCIVVAAVAFSWLPIQVDAQNPPQDESLQLAVIPKTVRSPANNPTTADRVQLGAKLFFDSRLSGDNSMSCATCHLPDQAYGDGKARSHGAGGKLLERNTPSCLNVGFLSSYFWDGRASSLEEQALGPIESPVEMNQDLSALEAELSDVPGYLDEFKRVFGKSPNRTNIAFALAAFQRTLVTGSSPFDRYLDGDESALSDAAKRGLELFRGEAKCIECHHGPMLTDGKYYRLGVSFRDEGRARITGRREDRYRFRTPTLRNIADTAPYMHNGSLGTLHDVVTFYFREIPDSGPDGLSMDTVALQDLSFSDIDAMVAFLRSLSGEVPVVKPPKLP